MCCKGQRGFFGFFKKVAWDELTLPPRVTDEERPLHFKGLFTVPFVSVLGFFSWLCSLCPLYLNFTGHHCVFIMVYWSGFYIYNKEVPSVLMLT